MRPLLVVLALGATVPTAEKDASHRVTLPIDVLVGEGFARLKGRHVGLVTNHTGRAASDGTRQMR